MWFWMCKLYLLFVCCNLCVLTTLIFKDPQLYEGSRCKLENGAGEGICLKANACPERRQQISEGDFSVVNRCGFQNFTELFCCSINLNKKLANQVRPAETACQNYKKMLEELNADGTFFTAVFNGVAANPGEFPHMAALGYPAAKDEEAGGIKYVCGGTLISEKHVLTAAHCVSNIQGFVPVEVLLGTTDLDVPDAGTMQRISISKIIKHPQHKQSLNYHDVAILELKNPIKFTSNVHPTCLVTKPVTKENLDEFTSFSVLGWGAIDIEGTTSTKLLKAEFLDIVDANACSKSYENVRAQIPNGLDDGMICVKDPDTTRRADTCWGDSGGPLLISSRKFPLLTGVTSFGQACGGTTPGVYASVYKYLKWIEDQVWLNSV